MRFPITALALGIALYSSSALVTQAQSIQAPGVIIDERGIQAPGVTIDSTGVYAPGVSITPGNVQTKGVAIQGAPESVPARPAPAKPATVVKTGACIPAGTYAYLFSDGYETYYYNANHTVRVDAAGNYILQKGDFDVRAAGNRYQRAGDKFIFTNINGRYSSIGNGPISFSPANAEIAAASSILAPGTSYSDQYGTYTKQRSGQVTFTPAIKLPSLVADGKNCGAATVASYDYDTLVVELGARKEGDALRVDMGTDILFDYDSAAIKAAALPQLEKLAYLIRHDRKGYVVMRGHTDSKGGDDYNVSLSSKRAQAVADWMVANGKIDRSAFVVQGLGEAYPIAANTYSNGQDYPEGRAKNRRVEVLIQTVEGAPLPAAPHASVGEKVQSAHKNAAAARENAAEARRNAAIARENAARARAAAYQRTGGGDVNISPAGIEVEGYGDDSVEGGNVSITPGGINVQGY